MEKQNNIIAFGLGFVAGYKGVTFCTHLIYLGIIGILLILNLNGV